jgi:hypothetical protein
MDIDAPNIEFRGTLDAPVEVGWGPRHETQVPQAPTVPSPDAAD